jgi:hypothetical protein
LSHYLDASLTKLHRIWSDIGICDAQRHERSSTVMLHLRNLLDEMIQEEESLKSQIAQRIEGYGEELLALSKDLAMPEYEVSDSCPP